MRSGSQTSTCSMLFTEGGKNRRKPGGSTPATCVSTSLMRTARPITPGSAANRRRHKPSLIRIASGCCSAGVDPRIQQPSQCGAHTQERKEVVGDGSPQHVLHLARVFQVPSGESMVATRSNERLEFLMPRNSCLSGACAGDIASVHLDGHDTVRLRIGQRTPQHPAHQAEHGRPAPMPSREREDDHGGEPRRPAQRTQGIANVLKRGFDALSQPCLAYIFFDHINAACFDEGLAPRFFAREASGDIAIGELIHPGTQLVVERGFDPIPAKQIEKSRFALAATRMSGGLQKRRHGLNSPHPRLLLCRRCLLPSRVSLYDRTRRPSADSCHSPSMQPSCSRR